MSTAPFEQISVGIVVERRKAASQWIDYTWRPVTALPGVPAAEPWTQLSAKGEVATFYAGAAEVALYRTDTAQYRDNLVSGSPALWVALRPTGVEPPFELVVVTADPAEGEALTQNGDHLVEMVPMPEQVRAVVEAFVAEHHVEQPFVKRKRDRADPEALARKPPKDGPKDRPKDRSQ